MTTLHVQEWGEGAPLVLLHGLFGSGDNWSRTARRLAERYHVLAPDARNHGRSFRADEHSYPAMAEDIAALCRRRNISNAVFLGHSMGGKTAMELLHRCPSLCRAVLAEDIGPLESPPLFRKELDAMAAMDLEALQSRRDAELFIEPHIQNRRVRLFLLKNLERREEGGFRWKINLEAISDSYAEIWKGIGPFRDDPEAVPEKVHVPFLSIAGENSDAVDLRNSRALSRWIPEYTKVTIPQSGHWVHTDQPERFLNIVQSFLSGI